MFVFYGMLIYQTDSFSKNVTNRAVFRSVWVKGPFGKEKIMDDRQIIELYWERSEDAISQTEQKYGRFCRSIAYNILYNIEDSEECVNDTYLKTWEEIPPKRPEKLQAFLGRITRNISLHRYDYKNAQKRGGGETALALDELLDMIYQGKLQDSKTVSAILAYAVKCRN